MEGSILEYVGADLIGVMSPVSICMLLVVLLVTALSSSSPSTVVTAANLIYAETPSDSPSQKLSGALLNAAVFVLLIAAVTFLLVLLYYFRFTSFLKHYMRLSSFFLLSSFGGSLSLSLLSRFSIPLDALTFSLFLLNFSVLGVVSVFGGPAVPIFLTQSYTVVLGIITAAWFTQLPEWTTWTLLVALALYDLAAVLAPGGPLKILVELSQSRDDDLPALVYEARPSVARSSNLGFLVGGVSDNGSVELQNVGSLNSAEEIVEEESSPLVENSGNAEEIVEEEEGGVTRGIKLGLGDFVFYSVLVGRAALYDWMTVYACYLAIISGLGCTLILLSVCRRALPALPISIALGVVFYFLTRLLMEPFVVGVSTNLMMF